VRGIRANKRSPSAFISASILECKKELKDSNEFVKANAIRKLTFLRMMGYEFSWANFATIEVMSSQRFGHKRVGYLSAAQSFNEEVSSKELSISILIPKFTKFTFQ
jgi:AP-3 complex subunit delta-1